jgi:hypothetical protein
MIFSLVVAIAIIASFFLGYFVCRREFVLAVRKAQVKQQVKRKPRKHKRDGATAIGFTMDDDEDGMVAM